MNHFIRENETVLKKLLEDLCRIPAPSFHEEKRAEFCKAWLEDIGAAGVYIDEANNVIFPLNCEGCSEITVFAAHTDTVFPDLEPMKYVEDDERIYCPGVGDDTASVAVLMMTVKFIIEKSIQPDKGVLFVLNSCEEGLGNLKGTRQLMQSYAGRVAGFITFDSNISYINHVCVGSQRYEVEVLTKGGHSFQDFGVKNAISVLAEMITEMYRIQVPRSGNARTTYNVGSIEGGTSVNTIAQSAKMLCEYRSDSRECLEFMSKEFERIFKAPCAEDVTVKVSKIGDRPCAGDVDPLLQEKLAQVCRQIVEETAQTPVTFRSASTDCNIPLSLGIPAVCIGVYKGGGSHTREEYIEKASLKTGLQIAIKTVLTLTGGLQSSQGCLFYEK